MRLFRVLSLVTASLLAFACGASSKSSTSSGAASDTSSVTSSVDTGTSVSSTTSTGTGGAGAGGGSSTGTGGSPTCDSIGMCGDFGMGCVYCAIQGACASQYNACFNDMHCSQYQMCSQMCSFKDPMCLDACAAQWPDGAKELNDLTQCIACDQCPMSCAMEHAARCH